MKANTKEILNNKAAKMIDLILDEVKETGGSKTISTSLKDERGNMNYRLDVQLTASSSKTDIEEEPSTIDPIEEVRTNVVQLTETIADLVSVVDSLSARVSALEATINNTE